MLNATKTNFSTDMFCLHYFWAEIHGLFFPSRFSDLQYSEGTNGTIKLFKHPFLQCWGLTLGEFSCMIIFFTGNILKRKCKSESDAEEQNRSLFSPFVFLPPSILHVTSRCFSYIALTLTTASSFQILCGCNLIFTCILSRIFLKRILSWKKWLGVFVIIIGK